MSGERILFVTGRFAEEPLRGVVSQLATETGFVGDVAVTKISVAALLHADWLAGQLKIEEPVDRVILPGWCQGDLSRLESQFGMPFELGPKDLFDLPAHFGSKQKEPVDLSQYTIEILAEINHAPRMTDDEIVSLAEHYRCSGADIIDLGCIPGESWARVSDVTKMLVDRGLRVSIDSFDREEVEAAVNAGAELVLSCNQSNIEWASQLDAELVAIPEAPFSLESLEQTIQQLTDCKARFRIDPILEPIGFGFAASLGRYFDARKRWPDLDIMMGIGNLTELTEVDSAGMNFVLAGICEELGIRSVLTTEVINWAQSSVREFDLARRLTRHSIQNRALPKHVDSKLVALRDSKLREQGETVLTKLADQITDPNYRIFAERGEIHVMNRDGYWRGTDPFELFRRVRADAEKPLSEGHTFYLGYEVCKAATALRLGKQYVQDEELNWGFLSGGDTSDASGRHETEY
ncbi:MAG: dihydropteroate synthase-like protein [Planctomycetaceae bacterium]|jgi:dihydropteroate synthase-like protein